MTAGCGGNQTVPVNRASLTAATSFPASTTGSLTAGPRKVTITEFPGPKHKPSLLCCIVSKGAELSFGYIYADGKTYVGQMTAKGVISGEQALSISGTMDLAPGPGNSVAYSTVNANLVNTVGLVTAGGATSYALAGECTDAFVATGSDGNLWTCGQIGPVGAPVIDRVTTHGSVTPFNAFPASAPKGATLFAIAPGPDGALWYVGCTAGGAGPLIGRMTTAGIVTDFSAAAQSAGAHCPVSIVAGPDGAMWFADPNSSFASTGRDAIGRVTRAGKVKVKEYVLSSGTNFTYPNSITAGPDGALWFTEAQVPAIGRITTKGKITRYTAGITKGAFPNAITTGPDGSLWFTEYKTWKIGRVSIRP
ncbi:MAG: hypothetical protein JO277_08940 [Candidatus Eremiobacteraeota bacterium]|nr:hypothetical protein [Candidatus Eremiobacteraeota bacterium]